MEKRKNLCAMIPETLYTQVCSEKEQLELTLSQYVERILKEHFEGGKAMANGTRMQKKMRKKHRNNQKKKQNNGF